MNRNLVILSALFSLLIVATCSADVDKDEADKLQGTWALTMIEIVGQSKPAAEGESSFTFDKDKMVMRDKGRADKKGSWKIDASKTPKQIDLIGEKGKIVGEAIYELKGDTLKMAFSIRGSEGKRPASFEETEALIMYLKREKK